MSYQNSIVIQGLCQNNLKNISLEIPKGNLFCLCPGQAAQV